MSRTVLEEKAFTKLIDIMVKLRGPHGCPWDKEQTHKSLKPYLLEEVYEVLETLDHNDFHGLKEELGDLLLQIIFHSQLASEENQFTILDVLNNINDKLIRRHPHVFGDSVINSSEEQQLHWEKLKKEEGRSSALDGSPKLLPALLRAHRIQIKASTVGFDWTELDDVMNKVDEELEELKDAQTTGDIDAQFEEFGDLLFSIVNLSRFMHINPEDALRRATDKFINRFHKLEKEMEVQGKDLKKATLDEMDHVWNRIKND